MIAVAQRGDTVELNTDIVSLGYHPTGRRRRTNGEKATAS